MGQRSNQQPCFIECFFQSTADNCHLVFGQIIVKRQGDSAFAYGFGNGEITLFISELLGHKRLQMYRREIIADLNALGVHCLQNLVPLPVCKALGETDDEYKPAQLAAGLLGWHYQSVVAG